jgi:hypothetical protein
VLAPQSGNIFGHEVSLEFFTHRSMSRNRRFLAWLLFILGGAGAALLLLYALPEPALRWAPIAVGSLWTIGLLYSDTVIRRDPGRFGLIGEVARAAGPRSAALVCGLLTLLLLQVSLRGKFGWPELLTGVLAILFLLRWLVATLRMIRTSSRRSQGMRRKPERWRPLRSGRR